MSEKTNKFDALAYAVSKLGPPTEVPRKRYAEASHVVVSGGYFWGAMFCERWLVVDVWSDGDQSTHVGEAGQADLIVFRNNEDGSLCPEYEEQARMLIDEFYEAWMLIDEGMR